jgi:dolichol-phosphate mannosyltransferase
MYHEQANRKTMISVVLSFFNEEEVIPELLERLRKSLASVDVDYELIFVNDASTDHSLALLLRFRESDPKIKILNMSRNFGRDRQGVCVIAGIEHAKGDAIIFMDTDLQDPPELLPQMIERWKGDDVDVVYTTRLSRAGETKTKLWITALGYKILQWVSEGIIPVDSGDFKLISRRLANHLMTFQEKRPFLRGLIPWVGYKQTQICYHREPRLSGKTKYWVISPKVINNFLSAVISYSDFPLKVSIFLGIATASGAFLLLFYALACKYFGVATPGSTGILVAVFLLSGIQLIVLGVAGLYIGLIFDEVRNRPRYIVESKIGFD